MLGVTKPPQPRHENLPRGSYDRFMPIRTFFSMPALRPAAKASLLGLLITALCLPGGKAFAMWPFKKTGSVPELNDAVAPAAAADMVTGALTLIGTPYVFGGSSPERGFDCSGLVQYIYRDISAVNLPRRAVEMSRASGRDVSLGELKIGDLIFFKLNRSSEINHVAVYIGEDRFVHAPRTGAKVRIDTLDSRYWMRYYTRARRLFSDDGHLVNQRLTRS